MQRPPGLGVAADVEWKEKDGPPQIRKGVAPDRTISVVDPEMRHGRKSDGRTYNGHKAHVAVEVSTGVLTAVEMGAPGDADGSHVKAPLEQTMETTGLPVEEALGDSAYGSTHEHGPGGRAQR